MLFEWLQAGKLWLAIVPTSSFHPVTFHWQDCQVIMPACVFVYSPQFSQFYSFLISGGGDAIPPSLCSPISMWRELNDFFFVTVIRFFCGCLKPIWRVTLNSVYLARQEIEKVSILHPALRASSPTIDSLKAIKVFGVFLCHNNWKRRNVQCILNTDYLESVYCLIIFTKVDSSELVSFICSVVKFLILWC